MELLSDLCPASGNGFAGFVNTDVCFDGLGLPYVPAKRLKGCLRECGLDILSVDYSFSDALKRLFGETGNFVSGTLKIGNGKLQNYSDIAANIGDAHTSELAEVYTSVRSRTKMEGEKAAEGMLRTARVLNKGQVYEFPVTLSDDDFDFLKMCVKSLRGFGLNRSRGLGEVKCELVDADTPNGVKFDIRPVGDKKAFSYSLELLEPVISAERSGKSFETEDYIFGSAVLGAFAAKYIERFGLERDTAYTNKVFRRIFLEGGVRFSAAMPCLDGSLFYHAPTVLRTDKRGKRLFDESIEVYDDKKHDKSDDDIKNPICKRLGGFVAVDENGAVTRLRPPKVTFPHHARPKDRAIAHATENDGEFYTYEALASGQTFIGNITGNEEDVLILADLFDDDSVLRLGRSRTAQYGKVKISAFAGALRKNELPIKAGDTFRLVAVTPIIIEDDCGTNRADVKLLQAALGDNYEVVRFACSETVVSGYYGKWLLPKRQECALAEGSTIVFRYNGDETILNLNFIGKRTGEGFGQIRIEPIPKADAFSFAKDDKTDEDKKPPKTIIQEVDKLRAAKNAVAVGIAFAETKYEISRTKDNAPKGANLSRVIVALKQATFEEFAKKLVCIKQEKQRLAALVFASGEDKGYFQKHPEHLEHTHIAALLEKKQFGDNVCYDYETYQKYLSAAAQRIKQKRRSIAKTKEGGMSE
jgi:CRISPR-associated protein Csx10